MGGVILSNSLPFLLAATGLSLDPNHFTYEEDFDSTIRGFVNCIKHTRLSDNHVLQIYRYCSISIDHDLKITSYYHDKHLSFDDFTSYRNTLQNVARRIVANATDKSRKYKYGLVTSMSRGYDSVATSVIAKEVGCDISLHFSGPKKYLADDGRNIAKHLGFKHIIGRDANKYLRRTDSVEAEIFCTGDPGGFCQFTTFEDYYSNCIYFSGDFGENLWERVNLNLNNFLDFSVGGTFSCVSTEMEHFLRTGTIYLSLPSIGANDLLKLSKITKSPEMANWTLYNYYDRPIARRIVEEAGIDREEFGKTKVGGGNSVHYTTMKTLRKKLSPTSYEDFIYFKKNEVKFSRFKFALFTLNYFWKERAVFVNTLCSRIKIKYRMNGRKLGKHSSPIMNLLILWSNDRLTKRYKKELTQDKII